MSQTLNINYDPYAPGTFALTFTVNGVAPNLSTGYGATMRIWRSGLPTTASPDVTVTAPGAIALGTSGSIILDLVVIHTALALVSSTEAVWSYDLIVTPTGAYSQKVCSGQLAEGVGSDAEADVSAPISVNWAGTVGGDLSGTLPNPTVDGLQGRTVASTAPTNGQVLAWNATLSQWEPTTGGGGSGTVTSITAGTGLTGGTITTSGTIAADIGTGATQVAAGNHTHTLAGDVQGDIATTVVHKVQGHEFSSGTPSNGDVWVYESSSTKWKHETLAGAGIAAAVHVHSGGDITSGTVGISYLPTGTSGTTVALGNHTHAASDIVSGVLATARLASSGTADATTFLRGDQTWSTIAAGSTVTISENTYTSSGTWTKPTGCQYIVVEACGAGGGGGSGAGASSGGAGGCGGLYGQFVIPVSLLTASTCDVTVGTGGTAGNDGGDTSMNVALASTNLFLLNGGRGASNASYSIIGTAATNGFAAGGSAGTNAGRHGGYGPAGGGGGGNAASGGAGGRACSLEYAATGNVAATGGGAAGGTAGNNGTTATTTIRGFGDGGGGGGGASTTAGGNGGNGTRGSGGGGGGGGTPVGTGGTGGDGFVRIISVSVT